MGERKKIVFLQQKEQSYLAHFPAHFDKETIDANLLQKIHKGSEGQHE